MKPFFAKHLPVEGEIKEGDKFLVDERIYTFTGFDGATSSISTLESGWIFHSANNSAKEWLSKHKKLKIFLCSRDTQVGDTYTCSHKGKDIDVGFGQPEQVQVFMTYTKERNLCPDCFKIIGEISPYAKWVKEGDEFDENEVIRENLIANPFRELHWHKRPLDQKVELGVRNEYGYTVETSYIKVKCYCCETFK